MSSSCCFEGDDEGVEGELVVDDELERRMEECVRRERTMEFGRRVGRSIIVNAVVC